ICSSPPGFYTLSLHDALPICYKGGLMGATRSIVISMRLPVKSGDRLKRMATRHGWTASDASARLVEEGLRRADFAFIDFRDSARSEEHTSELQSLAYLVCRLL